MAVMRPLMLAGPMGRQLRTGTQSSGRSTLGAVPGGWPAPFFCAAGDLPSSPTAIKPQKTREIAMRLREITADLLSEHNRVGSDTATERLRSHDRTALHGNGKGARCQEASRFHALGAAFGGALCCGELCGQFRVNRRGARRPQRRHRTFLPALHSAFSAFSAVSSLLVVMPACTCPPD